MRRYYVFGREPDEARREDLTNKGSIVGIATTADHVQTGTCMPLPYKRFQAFRLLDEVVAVGERGFHTMKRLIELGLK
jgi:hypothetical protein